MKGKNTFLLIVVTICCGLLYSPAYAQYNKPENNIWMFATGAGLNFNAASPAAIKSKVGTAGWAGMSEGGAAVCDREGKLLFSTDGTYIWDKNDSLMPNGYIGSEFLDTFNANSPDFFNLGELVASVTQGVQIVAFPGNNNKGKYYVFTLTSRTSPFPMPGNLYYSVVDMSLNNGLGDIVQGQKGLLLDSGAKEEPALRLTEKMTAAIGDSCNAWLIYCKNEGATGYATQHYVAYEITSTGISPTPVISTFSNTGMLPFCTMGQMVVSPDRKWIAVASHRQLGPLEWYGSVYLCNFDVNTGVVSNPSQLSDENCYSVCFSPDNSKLYMPGFQFDLKNNYIAKAIPNYTYGSSMRLGPDGKIYTNDFGDGTFGVINYPNYDADSCGYTSSGITKPSDVPYGLGNESVIPEAYDTVYHTLLDTLLCSGWSDGILLVSNAGNIGYTYQWNTGDTTDKIEVTTAGTYWLTYSNDCESYVDSFILRGADLFTTITINVFQLGTTGGPFSSYQWYFNGSLIEGATDSVYNVTSNGSYTVKVTNEYGCEFMSDVYAVTNWEDVSVDESSFAGDIHLYPNPSEDIVYIKSPVKVDLVISSIEGKQLASFRNAESISLKKYPRGVYVIQFMDQKGRMIKVEKMVKQ